MFTDTLSLNRLKNSELLLKLQKEIFGDELNTEKTSLQGFINDSLSELATQIVTTSVLKQDEKFLNTARIETSIDLIASMHSYSSLTIVPSEIHVIIDVLLLPTDHESTGLEISSTDTKFFFNEKPFILSGDILLLRNETSWFVKQKNAINFEGDIGDLISDTYVNEDGNTVITFLAKIKQMEKETVNFTIPVRQRLYLQKIDVDIPNNLVDVKISITDNLTGVKRELTKVLDSFNNFSSDKTKEIFLLKVGSNGYELWLEGGSRSKFIQSGTDLEITFFSSDGYIGILNEPVFSVKVPMSLSPRTMTCYSSTQGTLGVSKLSLLEKKIDIIRHIQTPNFRTVITAFDMENLAQKFFNSNSEDVLILMRRNDPIMRLIDFFVKLKNINEEVLLTNSLSLNLTESQFSNKIFISGHNKFYKNTSGNQNYMTETNSFEISQFKEENESRYFISPAYHKGLVNPLRIDSFMLNKTNFYMNLSQVSIVNSPLEKSFFPIIFKGSVEQINLFTEPTVTYSVTYTSSNKEKMQIDLENNEVEIFAVFSDNKNNKVGYIKLEMNEDNNFIFSKKLTPILNNTAEETFLFKEISYFDNLNLNSFETFQEALETKLEVYDYDKATEEALKEIKTKLPLDFKIDLVAFSNDKLLNNHTRIVTTKSTMLSEYVIKETTEIYKNISSAANLLVKKPDQLVDNLFIGQIPLVAVKEFYDSELIFNLEKRNFIYDQLDSLDKMSNGLFNKLEEPTVPSFKFFRTYGYTSDFANINDVNLEFNLEITASLMQNESEIRNKVKSVVVKAANDSRNNNSGDIFLSDIINAVLEVSGVRQVRILNFYDNIYRLDSNPIESLTRDELKMYVPSLLNIREDDINITFKY